MPLIITDNSLVESLGEKVPRQWLTRSIQNLEYSLKFSSGTATADEDPTGILNRTKNTSSGELMRRWAPKRIAELKTIQLITGDPQ